MDLIMYLMLGHFVGDFALQSDRMAQKKNNSKRTLTLHALIYALVIAGVLLLHSWATGMNYFLSWTVCGLLFLLLVLHWFQDYLKGHVLPNTKQVHYLDQILHIVWLYVLRLVIY